MTYNAYSLQYPTELTTELLKRSSLSSKGLSEVCPLQPENNFIAFAIDKIGNFFVDELPRSE